MPVRAKSRALSEDEHLAGNLKVLNFFHMTTRALVLLTERPHDSSGLANGALQRKRLCLLVVPASHVKDSSRGIYHY